MPGPPRDFDAAAFVRAALPDLPAAEASALVAVLAAPVAASWAPPPPAGAYRSAVREAVRKAGVPAPEADAWAAGLAAAGHAAATLAALETKGLLAPAWPLGGGSLRTLTPGAAERLGVRLEEFGPEDEPRWGCGPDRPVRIARRVGGHALVATVADGRGDVPDQLEASRRESERAVDPVTGGPMVLFGSVPVFVDRRLGRKARARRRAG